MTDAKVLYDLLNRRSGNAGYCRRAQIDLTVICVTVYYMILYEFSTGFLNYMMEAEFENEVTLSKNTRKRSIAALIIFLVT